MSLSRRVSQILLRPRLSLRPKSVSIRAFSTSIDSRDNVFDYTSGRWVYNDILRRKERSLTFNVDGLLQLAAKSVNRSPDDIISFKKLGEGGFNCTYLVGLRGGQQLVTRVPYPMTTPKFFAIASEVATIGYLRSRGIPAPKVYGYSPDYNNAAGTPYVFMEFLHGTKLSEIWPTLGDHEVISVIRQLTEIESRMMAISFPAGGSLYFTEDLKKINNGGLYVPLKDERFCVGPDTKFALWYGRRQEIDVNRGPYLCAQDTLAVAAHKEMSHLQQFGRPLLPMRRERSPAYKFQLQSPSLHIDNLNRYLKIATSLIPRNPALSKFAIRHPNLNPRNIFVTRSHLDYKVIGIFDWQHASILPMFLQAGIPHLLQNYGDEVSDSLSPPSLPDNFDELKGTKRTNQEYLYRRRLIHYHYVNGTKDYNPLHYSAFNDPLNSLRSQLFQYAGASWEGESYDLKNVLIEATKRWREFSTGDICPIKFNANELNEMAAVGKDLVEAIRGFEIIQWMAGVGERGYVSPERYKSAVDFLNNMKKDALEEAESAEARQEIIDHWPWDDMDEEAYM